MLKALDGDSGAYRRLLDAAKTRLEGYFARRLASDAAQAQDLVQETLLAIHAKRATFDRSQPFTAWAYAIARYKLVDHYRRAGRRRHVPLDEGLDLAAEDESAAAEARRDLSKGLAGLAPHIRDLVVSVKLREEPVADVAHRTGMSESAVKVAVHRGFRKLAARLRGAGEGEP